jgi:AcrR family transcriptional regulator
VPDDTKSKLLNAAESVALRDGVAHLTLDAVAAEAKFSKGGVLYHFPTKDALIRGMVERLIEQTDKELNRLAGEDPEPTGRLLRSYLRVTFPEAGTSPARANQVAAVLLSAILTNPHLLDPVSKHFADFQRRLVSEGLDERVVHIVRLAADGLWLSEMLRFPGPEGDARQALIDRLFELTRK